MRNVPLSQLWMKQELDDEEVCGSALSCMQMRAGTSRWGLGTGRIDACQLGYIWDTIGHEEQAAQELTSANSWAAVVYMVAGVGFEPTTLYDPDYAFGV